MAIQDPDQRKFIDVLDDLKKKDYKLKFRRATGSLYCNELHQYVMPEHFRVDQSFYFHDPVAPDADRMLYAISLAQGLKGFLVEACDVYMDNISSEMMKKLDSGQPAMPENDLIHAAPKKKLFKINEETFW